MQELIHVDAKQPRQTIEHFGASGAWWAQVVGGWRDESRNKVIQLLFDRQTGIGLSIYRYNMGAGSGENIKDPWRRAETFEVSEGVYNWTRDRNAVWVLKAAYAAGVKHFVAFVNSPPARMTVSGLVTGAQYGRPNLRVDMHNQFARYMVDVVRHLGEDEGVPIGWISPINEPLWEWDSDGGQEGCHYTVKECLAVTKALLQEIQKQEQDVSVSIIEAPLGKGMSMLYMSQLLRDPMTGSLLDTFSVHSYWSTRADKEFESEFARTQFPHIRLWMSEWTEMRGPADYGMESAMTLANTIHEDLTVASVTSWQYWIAVSKYNFRDGLIYVDENSQGVRETKRLWAMGNYSRFVRPGYIRIETRCDNASLKACAFAEPNNKAFVIVVINDSDDVVPNTGLSLIGLPGISELTIYETSDEHDLRSIYSGSVKRQLDFHPRSITTLLLKP